MQEPVGVDGGPLLQQQEFEWVLHQEIHKGLDQIHQILVVSVGIVEKRGCQPGFSVAGVRPPVPGAALRPRQLEQAGQVRAVHSGRSAQVCGHSNRR